MAMFSMVFGAAKPCRYPASYNVRSFFLCCLAIRFNPTRPFSFVSTHTVQRSHRLQFPPIDSMSTATTNRAPIMTRSRSNNDSSDIWKDTAVVTPLRSLSSSSPSDDKNGSVSSIAGNEKRNTRKTTQQSVSSRPSSSSSDSQDAVLDIATSSQKKRKRVQVSPATSKPETPRSSSPAPKRSIQKPTTKKSPVKKAKSSPKKSPKRKAPEPGTVKPPSGWEDIYSLVEELREDRSAPVDSDGGEELPDRDGPPEVFRFQVLIALMLSSQTKDAVVGETMRILQKHGLTIDNISNTTPEKLNSLIRKVGFHNNKTKYIKQVVEILREEYDGDIPQTADDMMKLPGIGPKMAYIIENIAWNRVTGIGIDTHMHRMFNELKWVKSKNPEQTRIQLEAWLPREKWGTVNKLFVGFGQEVQQFKPKLLQKSLACSRPSDALRLVKKLGLDYGKEGDKLNLNDDIREALKKK